MTLPNFTYELSLQIASANVLINNIPVATHESRMLDSHRHERQVNELLVRGENEFMIFAEGYYGLLGLSRFKGAHQDDWIDDIPEPWIRAQLRQYAPGVQVSGDATGTTLADCRWRGPKTDRGPGVPIILRRTVTIDADLPTWAWTTAETLDHNDPQIRAEALETLLAVRDGLAAGDTGPLDELEAIRVRELDSIYADYAELSAAVNQTARDYQTKGWLAMAELGDDDLILRPAAHGRLLECLSRRDGLSWQPAIQSLPADTEDDAYQGSLGFPIFLGRIDGRWHALR